MDLSVAILAAGQSKRFRSQSSKVLHRLCGKPLLFYPLTAARALNPRNIYIIVGPNGQDIQERFQAEDVEFVLQPEPRGTGDAVRQLESRLDAAGTLVVLPGDAPLIRPETLQQLVRTHLQNQGIATVLTSEVPDPTGYGRVVRSRENPERLLMIVEETDAFPEERQIREVNAGVYAFQVGPLFQALQDLRPDNQQQEYYLPDVLEILQRKTGRVYVYQARDWQEILGVNTRAELAQAHRVMHQRLIQRWQQEGVTFVHPESVYLEYDVELAQDVLVYPFTALLGRTQVGQGAVLGPGVVLRDARVAPFTTVTAEHTKEDPHVQHP